MKFVSIAAAAVLLAGTATSRAEVSEITIAQQFGVAFLPLMLMERDGLIEKHAKAAGVEVKTNWQKVAGPSVINDGLLSGNVHFGAVGAPSLVTLWSRTKSNVGVKGVAAMTSYPLYFVTRNPELKSLKELSSKDKIAVPVGEDLDAGDDAADGGGRSVRAAELPEVRRVHRLALASRRHDRADEQHRRRERAFRAPRRSTSRR